MSSNETATLQWASLWQQLVTCE